MPSRWQYPRASEAWALCSWCGQEYPASLVWLNPRFSWQCYKCWDGLIQRDQIRQPIWPFEGTRKTPAPTLQSATQGIDTTDNYQYYALRDRADGIVYDVLFADTISWSLTNGVLEPSEAIQTWNGWLVYLRGGFMQFGRLPGLPEVVNAIPWKGNGDLYVDSGGFLIYTPYVQELVTGLSGPPAQQS